MAGQREQIGQQLRGLYQANAQSQLRLLLNQRNSEAIARNLQYYEYLFAARREKMRGYLDAVQRLDAVQKKFAEAMQALQASQAQLERDRAALVGKNEERKQLLATLDTELKGKGNELEQLERDRASLQKVIEEIEQQRALAVAKEQQRKSEEARRKQEDLARQKEEKSQQEKMQQEKIQQEKIQQESTRQALASQKTETQPSAESSSSTYSAQDLAKLQTKSFSQGKGAMPWPVNGKLLSTFGATRKGGVTWEGVRISALAGSEVRAVHYGRVMYADWLRGQGMLIILDHGDGYMSLYAHNDVLLHEPGEWVQAGEPIARVGNSGGEKEPGLYFEIRKNGEPQNPVQWLSRK